MCVFTEEEGTSLQVSLIVETYQKVHSGVHFAVHVGYFVHAFIVYEPVVQLLDGFLAGYEVVASSAFVTHAPEDDAGMVAVAKHHSNLPVDILRLPTWHFAQAVVAVALQVCLIHHIDAIVVKEGIHAWVIGVVAGADGIEVVLLHE